MSVRYRVAGSSPCVNEEPWQPPRGVCHIVRIVNSASLPVLVLIHKGNIENYSVIFCGRGGTRTK